MTRAAWMFSRHPLGERDRRLLEAVGQRWRPRRAEAFAVDVVVDVQVSAAAVFGGVTVSAHTGVSASLDACGAAVGAIGDVIAADASAAVRVNADIVEVVVGVPARRTLWSFFDGDRLLISTSQRAMAVLLGGFLPSHEAATWMLSAGNLGPCAWDRRVHRLEGGTRLRLDRRAWSLTTTMDEPPSAPPGGRATAAQLRGAIASALSALPMSPEGWCLPLSGGVDSRALATMLVGQGRRPRCVTWASPTLASFPDGDLAVARRVGAALGLRVDEELMSPVDVDEAIATFVAESEGRVDHVGGYLDGFRLWDRLATRGSHAIVRGDEVMGWVSVVDDRDVLRSVEATRLGDLDGVDPAVAGEGARQVLPMSLQRGASESLATWRDRLYRGYRVPAVVAALADAKAGFVDTWSPLLSRQVVSVALGLSDDDRTDKRLFRRVAKPSAMGLPYAAQASVVGSGAVLSSPAFAAFARPLFEEGVSRNVLPPSWSALGAQSLALATTRGAAGTPSSLSSRVRATAARPRDIAKQLGRRVTPVAIRKSLWRRRHGVKLPMEKVPLRLLLIVLATGLLSDDGAAGAEVLR